MSHKAIRTLISDTIKSLDDSILFGYARASDFNTKGKKQDKRCQLDPLKERLEFTDGSYNLTKTYAVGLVFYRLDDKQGAEEQSAEILDETDLLSDQFVNKLNLFSFTESTTDAINTQGIEITNIRKEPVIKVTADVCTGFILQFDLIAPDVFDYCSIY